MKLVRCCSILLASLLALLRLAPCAVGAAKSNYIVYVGNYKGKNGAGIYACRLDAASGRLAAIGLVAETVNPSYLAIHPNHQFLYAANNYQGQGGGTVSAFAIDRKTAKLAFLNSVSTRGADPYFLTVDKTGRAVVAVNYASGSVVLLPIKEDGRLAEVSAFVERQGSSVNPTLQSGPHPHSVKVSADNRFAIVADRGTDQVAVYRLDALKGALTPNEPPYATVKPGSGPRHLDIHPNGKFVYVINELQNSVTAFDYDAAKGVLKEVQTVPTLPKDFAGNNLPADIHVHPSGKFLYGSNRGHDSIAVFQIDRKTGALKPLEHIPTQGRSPRGFGIDPTGSYLIAANQTTGNLVVFRIDRKTGRLTPTGQTVELGTPVCLQFVEAQ
jgi:6-phosphogluconolactonase